jgi:hypothetical protein
MHHIIAKENLDAEEVTYRYFFWFFMYEAQENLSRTETDRYGLFDVRKDFSRTTTTDPRLIVKTSIIVLLY